jgi:hypothetical protein
VTTAPPTETARRPRVMHVITHLDMGGAETVALGLIDALRDRIDFSLFAVLRQAAAGAIGRDMAGRLDRWRVPYRFGVGGRFKWQRAHWRARSPSSGRTWCMSTPRSPR